MFILFMLISTSLMAAIFGDGNSTNGVEDQRVPAPDHLIKSLGTIFCDGQLRGTAAHIRTPLGYAYKKNSIIVSAAHVLYHAETLVAYKKCVYRPQGKRLSGIDFDKTSQHHFSPLTNNKIHQADHDIVFISLKSALSDPGLNLQIAQNEVSVHLIGYNEDQDNISISQHCNLYASAQFASDYLLLHDCDAGRGASGGPLIDVRTKSILGVHGGTLLLLKNNNGAKIPRGTLPNAEELINQGRKIDLGIISELKRFTAYLSKDLQH
ncbi:MAG: trypsin-like peptidase domain-containing protein [Porticoccaceae bacterium]|nr:trypsin-like peptidase domain-containing protein [Porticoccaceae bacterium]MDG1475237.1 trypsin-like peptidase domain-containing protein [Porticoccaceae bacterium]